MLILFLLPNVMLLLKPMVKGLQTIPKLLESWFYGSSDTSWLIDPRQKGIVITIVRQGEEWRVQYQSVSWPAKFSYSAPPGHPVTLNPDDAVRIVGLDNITLLIEPA
jgi:hypothetical protein